MLQNVNEGNKNIAVYGGLIPSMCETEAGGLKLKAFLGDLVIFCLKITKKSKNG